MSHALNENAPIGHPSVQEDGSTHGSRPEGTWYEIRVRGHLGPEWSDWFEGLAFNPLKNGEMLLCGRIQDQAALIGVLTKLNRINLALISVRSSAE